MAGAADCWEYPAPPPLIATVVTALATGITTLATLVAIALIGLLTTLETTGTTLEAALTGRLASHLCGGVAQGGPDLIELHLHDGSLGTILCLIGTLLEATGGNHAHALDRKSVV